MQFSTQHVLRVAYNTISFRASIGQPDVVSASATINQTIESSLHRLALHFQGCVHDIMLCATHQDSHMHANGRLPSSMHNACTKSKRCISNRVLLEPTPLAEFMATHVIPCRSIESSTTPLGAIYRQRPRCNKLPHTECMQTRAIRTHYSLAKQQYGNTTML